MRRIQQRSDQESGDSGGRAEGDWSRKHVGRHWTKGTRAPQHTHTHTYVLRYRRVDKSQELPCVCVLTQGGQYFNRRSDKYNIDKTLPIGQSPTAKEAQAIADELFGLYVSEEVDKVELIYTKFVSLIASEPTIQVRLV